MIAEREGKQKDSRKAKRDMSGGIGESLLVEWRSFLR